MRPIRCLRRFCRNEAGSFHVESALLMPVVFWFTLAMLGLGFLAYEKGDLIQAAYEWSERSAYVWKDSHKDAVSGAFVYQDMDDVYAGMVSEGLGWLRASLSGFRQADIALPGLQVSGQSLSGRKLWRSSQGLDGNISGKGSYFNRVLEGEVRADWSREWSSWVQNILSPQGRQLEEGASVYVADPVEFLRTVELVSTYASKLKSRFSSPEEASKALRQLLPGEAQPVIIKSEAQAKAYLQQLLHANGTSLETPYGNRVIDVLDADGFAHEAKYTVNKTDAKLQIQKDAELIRTGKVKGVVWHFFLVQKTGKFDTTPALLRELAENGIMVVYHQ
ncbi:TadE/TadG family type IV pilus assembly protein [Paenibacillus sp. YN15]|uniref:TadE/TadG family type IV pilus assembly protein n=1 Tax=Paenibacillus sp. YN15 TaxID=1742774 RepID=UPI000DCC0B52|nr:TadE family protein [Paenibacillus sp. YN15]RAV02414.1 hypothetical protein DQG13_10340 [Paenibacillus sp. YN15]